MSANQFSTVVNSLSLSKNDKRWFPLGLFRDASHWNADSNIKLEVTTQSVIGFLRGLLPKRHSSEIRNKQLRSTFYPGP